MPLYSVDASFDLVAQQEPLYGHKLAYGSRTRAQGQWLNLETRKVPLFRQGRKAAAIYRQAEGRGIDGPCSNMDSPRVGKMERTPGL